MGFSARSKMGRENRFLFGFQNKVDFHGFATQKLLDSCEKTNHYFSFEQYKKPVEE
jgi:hypothetical protein